MPKDPGLAGDTCTFMEAVSGDGGTHNASGVWWLSPDISLTGPTSGPDKADPGQSNPVVVRFHRKGDTSDCVFPGAESMTVELWVANPSLVMAPNNPASTALIQMIGSPAPVPGATGTQSIAWTPPTGVAASDPRAPGHKCLIARCYPDNLGPSLMGFFVPDDPHVAQRNICIVPCGGPGAARRPGPCGLKVRTLNPDVRKAAALTLRAVVDLEPDQFVRATVLAGLRRVPGFKRLASRPPARFRFQFSGVRPAKVQDHTGKGQPRPSYEAVVKLAPGRVIDFTFIGDLTGASLGDAYVFHLTQTAERRRVQGGLTVVMVAV